MARIYAKEGLELNQCILEKQGVRLEFLKGKTLEEHLDALVEQGRNEEAEKLLFRYVEKVRRIHSGEAFIKHRNLSKYSEMFHRKEHFPVVESQYRSDSGKYPDRQ